MNDVLNDALSNLEHDNYERSYAGYENRQADIALIRAAMAAQPAASAEPVMRIYAEGAMRSVTEWLDGARDLTDGDHTLYAAPVAAQPADEELRRDALQNLRKEISLAALNARELFHAEGSMYHEGRRVAYEQCLQWIDAATQPKENSND